MNNYYYTICEPLNPEIVDKGDVAKENIIQTFEQFPWIHYLKQMEGKKDSEVYYSPSLEIMNKVTRHGLSISIVGDELKNEFFVFYKRPALVKSLFGLIKRNVDDHLTDITGQTKDDVLKILREYINENYAWLNEKIR